MAKQGIVIGMSGGIDSAVSALLLSKLGYRVIGAAFELWKYSPLENGAGNNSESNGISTTRALCNRIGCEFITEDLSEQFHTEIVGAFLREYENGRTPNPCVICNSQIKWRHLLQIADKIGIEKVATGHYARVLAGSQRKHNLLRGADDEKDQSYFLYRLDDEMLARTVLPLGHLSKERVRTIAELNYIQAICSRESQELCFMPDGGLKNFLSVHISHSVETGYIIDTSGKRIGSHNGIVFYTIGQRSGLGGGFKQPMYVVKILPDENTIVIGSADELMSRRFTVSNMVLREIRDEEFRCTARIRHCHNDVAATVYLHGNRAVVVEFDEPQRAIAPGQSAVFYDGLIVIGGGVIDEVLDI